MGVPATYTLLPTGGAPPYSGFIVLTQSGPDTASVNASTGVLSLTPAVPELLDTSSGNYLADQSGNLLET